MLQNLTPAVFRGWFERSETLSLRASVALLWKRRVAAVRALQSWKLIGIALRFFSHFTEVHINMRCLILGRTSQDFDKFVLYDFITVFYSIFQRSTNKEQKKTLVFEPMESFLPSAVKNRMVEMDCYLQPFTSKITCQRSVVRVTLPHSLKHVFSNIFLPSLTVLLSLMHL